MARAVVTPETIDYPDSDGLPMAENEIRLRSILYANSALATYYRAHDDVYVVGNLLLYYEPSPRPGVPGKSVSPDLMVILGAPKHMRSSYLLWEEPKAPDFVLEIASEGTYRSDLGNKRDIYEMKIGVSEYWLYDPVGDYLDPRLQGYRLDRGHYATARHGTGRWHPDGPQRGVGSGVAPVSQRPLPLSRPDLWSGPAQS